MELVAVIERLVLFWQCLYLTDQHAKEEKEGQGLPSRFGYLETGSKR